MKLAESVGVAGHRVATPEQLERALNKTPTQDPPALIEVAIDRSLEGSAWEFPMPAPRRAG